MGVDPFAHRFGHVTHQSVNTDLVSVHVVEPCAESVTTLVRRMPEGFQKLGEFLGRDSFAVAFEKIARRTVFQHIIYNMLDAWVDRDKPVSSCFRFNPTFQSPLDRIIIGNLKVYRLGDSEPCIKQNDDLSGKYIILLPEIQDFLFCEYPFLFRLVVSSPDRQKLTFRSRHYVKLGSVFVEMPYEDLYGAFYGR